MRYDSTLSRNAFLLYHMETNYLTSGDLAMWESARGQRGYGCGYDGYGYGYCHRRDGAATTAIGLGAGLGGGALLLAIAGIWGINQASKSRARGNENAIAAQGKTIELIAATMNREAVRQDGINIDVNQTQRSLSAAYGAGGAASAGANALATAEALALLNNSNGGTNPLSSVIQQNCALRVQRVATQDCGCGCGG